jgi:hypothetical protein
MATGGRRNRGQNSNLSSQSIRQSSTETNVNALMCCIAIVRTISAAFKLTDQPEKVLHVTLLDRCLIHLCLPYRINYIINCAYHRGCCQSATLNSADCERQPVSTAPPPVIFTSYGCSAQSIASVQGTKVLIWSLFQLDTGLRSLHGACQTVSTYSPPYFSRGVQEMEPSSPIFTLDLPTRCFFVRLAALCRAVACA